jgi:hypothetical protein
MECSGHFRTSLSRVRLSAVAQNTFFVLCLAMAVYPATLNGQTPSATDPHVALSVSEKATFFGYRIIAPTSLAMSAFTSGIDQWRDSPPEWGQGMAGYGRRYGSKTGTRAAENGIGFLTAAALHQDPRYFRSGETGFWRRTQYAAKATIVTRSDSGHRSIAIWKISANYGAQFVSNTWQPDRVTPVPDTLLRGSISMGYDAASNLFKEFWPDIRQRVFRR